jgi:hypothetical protein
VRRQFIYRHDIKHKPKIIYARVKDVAIVKKERKLGVCENKVVVQIEFNNKLSLKLANTSNAVACDNFHTLTFYLFNDYFFNNYLSTK